MITPTLFLIVLIAAVVLLCVMLIKLKMHPFLAILLTAIVLSLALGNGVQKTVELINANFGGTLTGIGLTVILGACIAMGVQDTGSATSITNFFIRLFRGGNLELAPTFASFVMSIPVFADITTVLISPIAAVLAKRRRINMTLMGTMGAVASSLTHSLVPPTPGILAVALMLGADVGMVILWGLVLSFVSLMLMYLIMRKWIANGEFVEPIPAYVVGVEEAHHDTSVEDLCIRDEDAPSSLVAFLPLLLPAAMIAIGTLAALFFPKDSAMYHFCTVIGDRVVALFTGFVAVVVVAFNRGARVRNSAKRNPEGTVENTESAFRVITDNWIGRGLKVALMPLMVTAIGGTLSGIIKVHPVVKELGEMIGQSGIPPLLIPFGIAAVLMGACGSATTASMTAAGIVAPIMGTLGLPPVAVALAIGSGSLLFWHMNNSGFWMISQMYGIKPSLVLKYISTGCGVVGIVCFIMLWGAIRMGLM